MKLLSVVSFEDKSFSEIKTFMSSFIEGVIAWASSSLDPIVYIY